MTASTYSQSAGIIGIGSAGYDRRPTPEKTTEWYLAAALRRALADAGLSFAEVDGLALASFSLAPDHVSDVAWQLGVNPRWAMEDRLGGVAGVNMLQHAVRAVECGDASVVALIAGDRMEASSFSRFAEEYTTTMRDYISPLSSGGFNGVFAMLTRRHMRKHGLSKTDYGRMVVSQRRWASGNPAAVYRQPLSLDEYLAAEMIADPLNRFDCVPVVSGAEALIIARSDRAASGIAVTPLASVSSVNHDNQIGNGLSIGIREQARSLWDAASLGPEQIDVLAVYDDYPAMALIQLDELGFIPDGDKRAFIASRFSGDPYPLNTSGGQLSAGQAGGACATHGIAEVVQQLRGQAGARQIEGATVGIATGYGSTIYRYGSCANAVVLQAQHDDRKQVTIA